MRKKKSNATMNKEMTNRYKIPKYFTDVECMQKSRQVL